MTEGTRRKVHPEGTLPTSSAPALQSLFCVKWQQKPLLAMRHHEQVLHGCYPAPAQPCKASLISARLNPVNRLQLVQAEMGTPSGSAAIAGPGRTWHFLRHQKGLQENEGVTYFGVKRLIFTHKLAAHRMQIQAPLKEFQMLGRIQLRRLLCSCLFYICFFFLFFSGMSCHSLYI